MPVNIRSDKFCFLFLFLFLFFTLLLISPFDDLYFDLNFYRDLCLFLLSLPVYSSYGNQTKSVKKCYSKKIKKIGERMLKKWKKIKTKKKSKKQKWKIEKIEIMFCYLCVKGRGTSFLNRTYDLQCTFKK